MNIKERCEQLVDIYGSEDDAILVLSRMVANTEAQYRVMERYISQLLLERDRALAEVEELKREVEWVRGKVSS